jgi:hypothetical protein
MRGGRNRQLDLSANDLRRAPPSAIADLADGLASAWPHLTAIDLSNNNLLPEAMAAVGAGLGGCCALTALDLTCNVAREEGATALASSLARCSALVSLALQVRLLSPPPPENLSKADCYTPRPLPWHAPRRAACALLCAKMSCAEISPASLGPRPHQRVCAPAQVEDL